MSRKSTPINNIIRDNNNNNDSRSEETDSAQKILEKYNEYETDDNDAQLQRKNERSENIQMDTAINHQQRLSELERIEEENYELHRQNKVYANNQQNKGYVVGTIEKIKNILKHSTDKMKDSVIVIVIFIILNLEIVCNLLDKYIPFDLTGFNGIIIRGVFSGILFYIISTLLLIL